MESANRIREAKYDDAPAITKLLQGGRYQHIHLDWRPPIDWIGTPGFVVSENDAGQIEACLAIAAEPPPAAWVRVAAIQIPTYGSAALTNMLVAMLPYLRSRGVTEIAWMAPVEWPAYWLQGLGMVKTAEVEAFVKSDLFIPAGSYNSDITIRPVTRHDMSALEAIEKAAFDPIWRHSLATFSRAWRQALCFDVAVLEGRIVGFQYSTRSNHEPTAHLVRITVDPQIQGKGVGRTLLAHAIATYERYGLHGVTLNTQMDNYGSQRLYARFGFYPAGFRIPVWTMKI